MDQRWREIVGSQLQTFIKQKFRIQKDAARQLNISESALSRIISGERTPNRILTLKIIKLGFDKKYFEEYDSLEEINPEELSKQDLIDLIRERRIFAKQQQNMIDFLSERLERFINLYENKRREINKIDKEERLTK